MTVNIEELIKLITKAQGSRTQNQFALACGLSSASLTRIKNGAYTPKPSVLSKIAEHASGGVTYSDLMYAAGYMPENYNVKPRYKNTFPLAEPIKLPILGEIKAGRPISTEQGNIVEWEFSDEEYADGEHFMLNVIGDSMSPTVPNGSIAIIRAQNFAEKGQVVAFALDGDYATLKRIYPQPNGSILLRGDNPEAESYTITKEDLENGYAHIIGVAVAYKAYL